MKLVGIVGSNSDQSYNRMLMKYVAVHFGDLADIEILDTSDVPLFNQSNNQTNSDAIQYLNRRILAADGVIIATPEHNHTIPANLKSLIEWLSFDIHPFDGKPVMIMGASYFNQGTSRAQLHLRQILEAPGVNAITLPGNEFLLANVRDSFDENGSLKDQRTSDFLKSTLAKFVKFVDVINALNKADEPADEDLSASGKISTTIDDVDMLDDNWVEVAGEKVHAVDGNTYVKLERGLLTVDQINYFMSAMPMELTYADSNNQFIYYNHTMKKEEMLAGRQPGQVGNPLGAVHPDRAVPGVKKVIQALRSGKQDHILVHVPLPNVEGFIIHDYRAMHDDNGEYMGINEIVMDIQPTIDWYLKQTNQELIGGKADGTASASQSDSKKDQVEVDAKASASTDDEQPASIDTARKAAEVLENAHKAVTTNGITTNPAPVLTELDGSITKPWTASTTNNVTTNPAPKLTEFDVTDGQGNYINEAKVEQTEEKEADATASASTK